MAWKWSEYEEEQNKKKRLERYYIFSIFCESEYIYVMCAQSEQTQSNMYNTTNIYAFSEVCTYAFPTYVGIIVCTCCVVLCTNN